MQFAETCGLDEMALTHPVHPSPLPVVVMVGFGGSRLLFDSASGADHPVDPATFETELQLLLATRLKELPKRLGLTANHFLCGQSQVAVGADTLFTRVCADQHIAQRIVLPEGRENFLHARSSNGDPDFKPEQRDEVVRLLGSEHVVDERVASQEPQRDARFLETNIEIVQTSDIVVCLIRGNATGKAGGAQHLMDAAMRRRKPVWEITVTCVAGRPKCQDRFHHWPDAAETPEQWHAPTLPADLVIAPGAGAPSAKAPPVSKGLPTTADHYLATLRQAGSQHARRRKLVFGWLARLIIGTHVLATTCAVFAMKQSHEAAALLLWLLGIEIVLLAIGFASHLWLHHSNAAREWAMARLVAEVARSAGALAGLAMPLKYLFQLPFPTALQPLLRTIDVLHQASAKLGATHWRDLRKRYLAQRLHGDKGQIEYYARALQRAKNWRGRAQVAFYLFGPLAFLATVSKLLLVNHIGASALSPLAVEESINYLGVAAILLPLFAVAALSLAAAADLDARVHTYGEVAEHLAVVEPLIRDANDETEFRRLVAETEARLLGETAIWVSRRSFTGVT
jgi:hypothetical protein